VLLCPPRKFLLAACSFRVSLGGLRCYLSSHRLNRRLTWRHSRVGRFCGRCGPCAQVTFWNAGHILGNALLLFRRELHTILAGNGLNFVSRGGERFVCPSATLDATWVLLNELKHLRFECTVELYFSCPPPCCLRVFTPLSCQGADIASFKHHARTNKS
jgi:hypothetical protein